MTHNSTGSQSRERRLEADRRHQSHGAAGMEHGVNIYAIGASLALAVLLFVVGKRFPVLQRVLQTAGYAGTFSAGVLYVYSFTKLPAAALLFIIAKTQNRWLAGTVATLGAVVGDLVLFGLFRSAKQFSDDRRSRLDPSAGWWKRLEVRALSGRQPTALMILVLVVLLLPLPNEFADLVLARIRRVRTSTVLVISYVGNGLGLYAIAWLARFR
jgi:membrane protein YqaA with SNARE-associated domain